MCRLAPCLHMHMPQSTHTHTHTHGGAAQLEVGYLTVSASWPSALNCTRGICSPHSVRICCVLRRLCPAHPTRACLIYYALQARLVTPIPNNNNNNNTFTQLQVKEALNIIYMERWDIHRNSNPYSTSIGYTMCRYINWIDEVNVVCNIQYNKHMRMRINNYMNVNMIRFRVE